MSSLTSGWFCLRRKLISWRSGPEGDDKTLKGLVVLLLEKEKDLKTLHETIATKDAEISGLRAMMQVTQVEMSHARQHT